MNRRQIAARVMNGTGATALLERWIRAQRPDRVAILMYHRVAWRGAPGMLYADVVGPSPELFEEQVSFLASSCRVLGLEEYLERREKSRQMPPRAVIITVDDGYADCYTTIYPILKRYGLSATVFLPTGYLDAPSLFWWDRLANMVLCCAGRELVLDRPRPARFDLNGPGSRQPLVVMLANMAKRMPHDALDGFLRHVAERTGVDPDENLAGRNYLMTWDQVRVMAADGIAFGAHTVTHPILARVDLDRARWEGCESKRRLEMELGRTVQAFAYPSGEGWTYDSQHRELLRAAGFRCAVTTIEGVNEPGTDAYALRRLQVRALDSPAVLRAALTGGLAALDRLKDGLLGRREYER